MGEMAATGVAAFFYPISFLSIASQQHSRNNSSVECIQICTAVRGQYFG